MVHNPTIHEVDRRHYVFHIGNREGRPAYLHLSMPGDEADSAAVLRLRQA